MWKKNSATNISCFKREKESKEKERIMAKKQGRTREAVLEGRQSLEIRGESRKFGNRKASFNEITRRVKLLWKERKGRYWRETVSDDRKEETERRKGMQRSNINSQVTPKRRKKKLKRGKERQR